MQGDSLTRVLLAGILLCLVILVLQGLGEDEGDPNRPRYSITGMRAGAPVLIRIDSVTGRTWKLEMRGGGNRWIEFIEPEAGGPGSPPDAPQTSRQEATPRELGGEAAETAVVEREIIEPPGGPALDEPPPVAPSLDNLDEDIPTYLEALQNPELPVDVRVWAATQLGMIGDPRALDALLAVADTPDPEVALAVVGAIARHDDPRVRPALEAARHHPALSVQQLAARQLSELDGS